MAGSDDPNDLTDRAPERHAAHAPTDREIEGDEFGLGLRTPPWNVVVTARSDCRRKLRRGLAPLIRLRRSGYRNVLTGWHDDPTAFLDALGERLDAKPYLRATISRLMTVEHTFSVDPSIFSEQLEEQVEPLLERLTDKTFHVRLERRGHKGRINSKECEARLGGYIYDRLASRGFHPVVTFADPDVIVVVEIIDDRAGIRLLSRQDRQHQPLLKLD